MLTGWRERNREGDAQAGDISSSVIVRQSTVTPMEISDLSKAGSGPSTDHGVRCWDISTGRCHGACSARRHGASDTRGRPGPVSCARQRRTCRSSHCFDACPSTSPRPRPPSELAMTASTASESLAEGASRSAMKWSVTTILDAEVERWWHCSTSFSAVRSVSCAVW